LEEIDIFINLCTKEDLIKYIKLVEVKVKGFTKNFKNAPKILLKNSLKKELEKHNYAFYEGLISSIAEYYDQFKVVNDFDAFIINVNRESEDIPQANAFAIFANKFPEKKEEYLPKIKDNMKNDKFIFDINLDDFEINEQNANDKFYSMSGMSTLAIDFYNDYIKRLKLILFKYYDENEYHNCFKEVEDISWLDFTKLYYDLIKKYDENIVHMSYLSANEEKILSYDGEIAKIHLLLIYELYLELILEDKREIENEKEKLVDDNNTLEEKLNYLEKQNERQEKSINKLEKKNKNLQDKLNDLKINFKDERKDLNDIIKNQKTEITKKSNIIEKLQEKNKNLVSTEELLSSWGYNEKEDKQSDLVIINYEDSELFKLFFGKYKFIKSNSNLNDFKLKLKNIEDKFIIINKANLSTQKLLEIENFINSKKKILLSYNPKDLVYKIIKQLKRRR
jgi:hypothetical protein